MLKVPFVFALQARRNTYISYKNWVDWNGQKTKQTNTKM